MNYIVKIGKYKTFENLEFVSVADAIKFIKDHGKTDMGVYAQILEKQQDEEIKKNVKNLMRKMKKKKRKKKKFKNQLQ